MHARLRLWHVWSRQVVVALPQVRVTQARGLALVTLAVIWAGGVSLSVAARCVPLPCHPLSTERRLRRWLASTQDSVAALWQPLRRDLLVRLAGPEVVLVFDPTPFRDRATLLVLSVILHKRALPLSWRVVPQQQRWPAPLRPHLAAMVAEIGPELPPGTIVTLLADRGLIGPTLLDVCQGAHWHVVLRLRGGPGDATRVQRANGTIVALSTLVTHPGQRLAEPVALFKAAGWRAGWLTIYWSSGQPHPWVLFSDRPGGGDRVREYRRRSRVEATYQDWKQRGFDLERSRLRALGRLERLVLVLALATWWLHGLGQSVIRSGQRRHDDRPDRRDRSLLQLGRRRFMTALDQDRCPPLPFRPHPTGLVYRWAP